MKIQRCTVGEFAENCYLVSDETTGQSVLIDPGAEGSRLVELIRNSGTTLQAIWLTHAHIDHIGAINDVRRAYPVDVYMHPLDEPYYSALSARAAVVYGVSWDQPDAPTSPLAEGDVMRCGDLSFDVLHVPGHAPGHVAFVGHGAALSGDLLFEGSIGRTDLPLSNPFAMDQSLERFAGLPLETSVYPGHGGATTIGRELRSNPFLSGRARTIKR